MYKATIIVHICLLLFCSCRITKAAKRQQDKKNASMNNMTCDIKGQIVEIINTYAVGDISICAKYSCIARVKILQVNECGPSVSLNPQQGDTIYMRFAYSLS